MTPLLLSLVQLAAGVAIVPAPCPYTERAPEADALEWTCYDPATRGIYLARQDRGKLGVIFHEYGHADDVDRLTPAQRNRFKRLLGFSVRRGWWDARRSEPPAEEYAWAFSDCALGLARAKRAICDLLPLSAYGAWRGAVA